MASRVGGGVEFWLNLPLLEMVRWIQDAIEAQKEDERAERGVK